METNKITTIHVIIKGRVQGVCYRDWTVREASKLNLSGWVRNRYDGTVEAIFKGSCDKVEKMLILCKKGPFAANVTGIEPAPAGEPIPPIQDGNFIMISSR